MANSGAFLANKKREIDAAWVNYLVDIWRMPRHLAENLVATMTDEQWDKFMKALSESSGNCPHCGQPT